MKIKNFDCVEMKREAAEKIYEKVSNMTREEELRYWNSTSEDPLKLNVQKINPPQHNEKY